MIIIVMISSAPLNTVTLPEQRCMAKFKMHTVKCQFEQVCLQNLTQFSMRIHKPQRRRKTVFILGACMKMNKMRRFNVCLLLRLLSLLVGNVIREGHVCRTIATSVVFHVRLTYLDLDLDFSTDSDHNKPLCEHHSS